MNSKRLDYLDMAKGIGIILVVAGHSGLVSDNVLTWLASFHMPLFFIISGMLLLHKKEEERNYSTSMLKKARGTLLPYFYFSIIYIIIDIFYVLRHPDLFGWNTVSNAALETVSFYGISVLWFLPALFLGEALFLFIRKKTSHAATILLSILTGAAAVFLNKMYQTSFPVDTNVFLTGLGLLIRALLRSGIAMLFLAIGYYTYMLMQKKEFSKIVSSILAIVLFGLNGVLAFYNGRVDLHFMVFNNALIYFLAALFGTMAVIFLCKSLPAFKCLSFLGENSLTIMATHLDCQVMIFSIRVGLFVSSVIPRAKGYVYTAATAFTLFVVEILLILVINRYAPFLLGKKKQNKK